MPAPLSSPNPLLDSLASYPHWFVAACVTIVMAAAIWILAKLLKWGLYVMIALVLAAGSATTVWLILHPK